MPRSSSCTADVAKIDHYISLPAGNDSVQTMQDLLGKCTKIKGFLKRYRWVDLEPRQNTYDLWEIAQDVAFCEANQVRLVAMVEDKSFNGLSSPVPVYAKAVQNSTQGYTAVRWEPETKEGYLNLFRTIDGRFWSSSGLEGLATQETAPSLSAETLGYAKYDPLEYAQVYKDIGAVLGSSFYWFFNYFPQDQSQIGEIIKTDPYINVGGPDLWPNDPTLVKKAYTYYPLAQRRFIHVSLPSYDQDTVPSLYKYARDTLKVQTMFWVYNKAKFPDVAKTIMLDATN